MFSLMKINWNTGKPHLSDASRQYQHLTWWEAEQIQKAIKTVEKQHSQLKSVAISELQDFTDKIIHTAQSRQAQAGVHQLSKAQRTRDIRQNKQEAIQSGTCGTSPK